MRVLAPQRRGSVIILILYYFLAGAARVAGLPAPTLEYPHFFLKRPNSLPVPFTYIVLDIFSKYDDRVVILFHTALRTLNARLEPFHNTLGVEHVFTLEFLIGPLGLLKTHSTCAGKVGTAHPVLDGLLFALRPIPCES